MACGVCANCKEGLMPSACLNMRESGFRPDSPGGMGEFLIIEEQYAHAIPGDWSVEMAAWVETFSIGYFGIWGNGGYIDASDTALILGAGPVGISATMVCATSGAKQLLQIRMSTDVLLRCIWRRCALIRLHRTSKSSCLRRLMATDLLCLLKHLEMTTQSHLSLMLSVIAAGST